MVFQRAPKIPVFVLILLIDDFDHKKKTQCPSMYLEKVCCIHIYVFVPYVNEKDFHVICLIESHRNDMLYMRERERERERERKRERVSNEG